MQIFKLLPLVIFLAACAPSQQSALSPQADISAWGEFQTQNTTGETAKALGWREFFKDPQLQTLIQTALEHNHDLKKAALSLEMAQAQWAIQVSSELPSVVASAGASKQYARKTTGESYNVGLGLSSFELDFFGKTKALSDKALSQYLATREAKDTAQLSIVSAVAKSYYQLRHYQAQKELAANVLKTREESYRLSKLQHQSGFLTDKDLLGVQSLIDSAKSSLIEAERNEKQAQNTLSQLLGKPWHSLNLPQAGSLKSAFAPLNVGRLPSEVLLNRPDLRQAEFQLQAAGADIQVARAAFYPSISLSSNLGFGSADLSNLLSSNAFSASIGPSIMLPIFDRDRLQRQLDIAESAQKLALENYQAALESAFYEVANALLVRESLSEQYTTTAKADAATQKRLKIEQARLKAGVISTLDILDAQRESYTSSMGLLGMELQIRLNEIDLYKATGGGLSEYGINP